MQEKDKNVSTIEFLTVYGPKKSCNEWFDPNDDVTDQRAPVNNPLDLYNQFVLPEDVMEELENEKVEDFDRDVYDYEDRTDLGVDIAEAQQLDLENYIRAQNAKRARQKKQDKSDIIESDDAQQEEDE